MSTPQPESNSNKYEQSPSDIDYHEYFIMKDNIIYKIFVGKDKDNITIQVRNYMIMFNYYSKYLPKFKFERLDDAYDYIVGIFDDNKAKIDTIIQNKYLKMILYPNYEKEIELSLSFNKENKDFIKTEIIKLKNDMNDLKTENKNLKRDISILKSYHNNAKDIDLLSDISTDSFAHSAITNTFLTFKAINETLYLIYATLDNSLICYDIEKQKKIRELKNYHSEFITNFRHYLDEQNKRDLVMSISKDDNNIRVWNIKTWECVSNVNANRSGWIYSACFLKDNTNKNYIVSSNINWEGSTESIKVYNFNSKKAKEIRGSNERTFIVDSYYDNITSKSYIISGNENYVKSYDFNKNELYHKYHDGENGGHFCVEINNVTEILKLIESCEDGNIRIWNFDSGTLLSKIKVSEVCLYGFCSFSNNYLYVGSQDKIMRLVDISNGVIVKSLQGHKDQVLTIKKIEHAQYGECLITQGWVDDQIKLWVNKNNC